MYTGGVRLVYGGRETCIQSERETCIHLLVTYPQAQFVLVVNGRKRCRQGSDGFAVALPVGLDEFQEVGAGVFRYDLFCLDPLEILACKPAYIPFAARDLAGLLHREIVKFWLIDK